MLLPAITWQSVFYRRINQLLIMWFDDAGYVLGATVAHLQEGGKWWRNCWRNLFPTFVETALLKGGLNQMMLRCRFLFVWLLLVLLNFSLKSVYPLSLRAFSYWYLDELKTSSLEEFLDKRSLIIFGNWLIICGGWFEDLLIYNNKSFGFLYGLYVPLFKLNVMSKKSTILRLVSW